MQSVFNSIAVLSILGVVLLLFANSALLKIVRDLQAALIEVQSNTGAVFGGTPAMTMAEFAAGADRSTYVLVVDENCPACHERAGDYRELPDGSVDAQLVVLAKDKACVDWFAGSGIRVVLDPVILGRVGVGVTPTLLKYDAQGTEQWRRVVGSRADLHRLLDTALTPAQSTGGTGA